MRLRLTPEVVVLAALLALSLLALVFMDGLVAKPKVLFGRSLSALAPSLFPTLVLAALAALCAILLFLSVRAGAPPADADGETAEWRRGLAFFAIMILYALTMQPIGFILSTALGTALLSWLMGNRSVLQAALVSLVAPVLLYLAATRLLAVSLPELDAIERMIARVLG